jgi:transposase InsO family protein
MSERIDSELIVTALDMALSCEQPQPGLLAHSDRGVQHASDRFQQVLARHGIVCSVRRKANCWDNALPESLIATIKKELVHQLSCVRHARRGQKFVVRVHRSVLQPPASPLSTRRSHAGRNPRNALNRQPRKA